MKILAKDAIEIDSEIKDATWSVYRVSLGSEEVNEYEALLAQNFQSGNPNQIQGDSFKKIPNASTLYVDSNISIGNGT